ncbi:MAG: di-heme enzyme [Gammaproteobacteria bacterium]|nr:di-heme enzyme [Gammaproteobacteria bacterium]
MKRALTITGVLAGLAFACIVYRQEPDTYAWQLPEGYPPPFVPADNPMRASRVALGRWLFYDTRLSGNGTMSCATCHLQSLAFTDGRATSLGSTGMVHPRNAMSLVNAAYASRLTWANPLLARLEDQALTPLLGDRPVEMGMGGREAEIGALLASEENYRTLARSAFPDDEDPFSLLNAIRAIAAFVRSIVSYDSPYDRYLAGDLGALSSSAEKGMDLFFSERLECFHCHGGFNFTDSTTHANTTVEQVGFHNNGLYNLEASGAYPADNTGLFDMTGQERDMGRFKAPSLRNVALTAPYMHDGSIATLDEVLLHYARGGRLITEGPYAGDGRLSPFKSEFVNGFELSDEERTNLLDFLAALTDESVLTNERWTDPFVR